MWKNIVERGRPQMIIWRIRVACWVPMATNTHTGCVILIAFPLQQWLHESYTYIAYHVKWKESQIRWRFYCFKKYYFIALYAYECRARLMYSLICGF